MGGQPTRRKKFHRGNARETKAAKGKKRERDLDQIYEDLQPQTSKRLKNDLPVDLDLPGSGQFYCIECARYFVDARTLADHARSKVHKQRVKELKTVPFSQAEAEAAAGMGSYRPPTHYSASNLPSCSSSLKSDCQSEIEKMSITSP